MIIKRIFNRRRITINRFWFNSNFKNNKSENKILIFLWSANVKNILIFFSLSFFEVSKTYAFFHKRNIRIFLRADYKRYFPNKSKIIYFLEMIFYWYLYFLFFIQWKKLVNHIFLPKSVFLKGQSYFHVGFWQTILSSTEFGIKKITKKKYLRRHKEKINSNYFSNSSGIWLNFCLILIKKITKFFSLTISSIRFCKCYQFSSKKISSRAEIWKWKAKKNFAASRKYVYK